MTEKQPGRATKRARGRPKARITNPDDYLTIETLAAAGKGKVSIAKELGMSPHTFRKLLERDERAANAWQAGLDSEFEAVCQSLRGQAEDKGNPRSVQAAALLLKIKHNVTDTPAPAIQINLPAPMAAKDYEKLVQQMPQPAPAIEHKPARPKRPEEMPVAELLKRGR
jgi:hypothetical protein